VLRSKAQSINTAVKHLRQQRQGEEAFIQSDDAHSSRRGLFYAEGTLLCNQL
jgi:hypothetical protein